MKTKRTYVVAPLVYDVPDDSNELTRKQLEADHVQAGVAKWGEAERDGLERQAKKRALDTLRADYDLRHSSKAAALDAIDKRQAKSNRPTQYQAAHCNEEGPT